MRARIAYSSPIVPETNRNGVSGDSSRDSASAAMPSKCGIEKSEMITCGENRFSSSRNDCSLSARR
ncbi:hypothetical protein D3C83_305570 [compost metagenome]